MRRIAALAQLEIDEREIPELAGQLQAILEHVGSLERLDVTGVPEFSYAAAGDGVLREDEVAPGLTVEQATGGAPEAAAGHFRVPRVLEG